MLKARVVELERQLYGLPDLPNTPTHPIDETVISAWELALGRSKKQ
jgi:hypothetical protein